MALYDTHAFNANDEVLAAAWSNSEFQPILAVSLAQPKIIFLQEDGSPMLNFEIHKKKPARVLRWHPVFPALAIGWEDGEVMLWNEDDRLCREDKVLHRKTICNITFSSDGTRLVTADVGGTVGVWRTQRGLTPICSFTKPGRVTNVIFCGLAFVEDSMEKWNSFFFFGGESGSIYLADDLKHCTEVCKVGGSIKSLLYYEKQNSVVIVSSNLLLVQFRINLQDRLVPDKRAKLSVAGDPNKLQIIWAGSGLLAASSGENMIRLFNLEKDQNYVLTLADENFKGKLLTDKITSIGYNAKRRLITCGTQGGFLVFWRCKQMTSESPASADAWEAKFPVRLPNSRPIEQIQWGLNYAIAAALSNNAVSVVAERVLKKRKAGKVKLIQMGNKEVSVRVTNPANPSQDNQTLLRLEMTVKGMDTTEQTSVFWNGKEALVYEIGNAIVQRHRFESKATVMALSEEGLLYQGIENKLEITDLENQSIQTINFNSQTEGSVNLLAVRGKLLAMATSMNLLKLFTLGKDGKAKALVTRRFEKEGTLCGEIKSLEVNEDATQIAMLSDKSPLPSIKIPDTHFYIYDVSMDRFVEKEAGYNRIPVEVFWDEQEARMLAVETEFVPDISKELDESADTEQTRGNMNTPALIGGGAGHGSGGVGAGAVVEDPLSSLPGAEAYEGKTVEHFFVTTEHGVRKWDTTKFEEFADTVVGVRAPFMYYLKNGAKEGAEQEEGKGSGAEVQVLAKVLRDFEKVQKVEEPGVKRAILDFSFHLTCDNLDEAYNSVRAVSNVNVWKALALMCVKSGRLDVAQICLGNMRFARGAKAVREAQEEEKNSLEAQLAMVALQLNMKDEARALYEQSGRADLLTKMLISSGEFEKALELAKSKNRINLKHTFYKIAQNYESIGEYERAIEHYELSGTAAKEVPRMLWKQGLIERLRHYCETAGGRALKWWAQFQESQGQLDAAITSYRRSQDFGSVVRLCIQQGDLAKAQQVVLESGSKPACFHLAQALEAQGDIREAIQFYARASKLHQAVVLARENSFDQEVLKLSLKSSKAVQAQSALYFEKKLRWEGAARLFHASGNTKKALEICKKYNLYEVMKDISTELASAPSANDSAAKTAQFFIDNAQYDKAVHILVSSKQIDEALTLCEQYQVQITEELAQKMVPAKSASKEPAAMARRKEVLLRVAKIAKHSGLFVLACKSYAAGGELVKAMKALIRAGDESKIVVFANKAKHPQVFVLAGNFLQNSDWHSDAERMKTIIEFYTKANAFESLASFYDACAQVEIDEYREYGKALDALKEARAYLEQATAASNKVERLSMIDRRMEIISQVVEAKQAHDQKNTEKMLHLCNLLLDSPDVSMAVRVGDVFAMLVEHYYQAGDKQQAYDLLERMRQRKIVFNPYVDPFIVQDVYNSVGQPPDQADDVPEEEVIDEEYEF